MHSAGGLQWAQPKHSLEGLSLSMCNSALVVFMHICRYICDHSLSISISLDRHSRLPFECTLLSRSPTAILFWAWPFTDPAAQCRTAILTGLRSKDSSTNHLELACSESNLKLNLSGCGAYNLGELLLAVGSQISAN